MILSLLPLGPAQTPFRTLYAMRAPLRLGALKLPETAARYGLVELDVDAAGTYDDPFNPAEVRLDATVTGPDGSTVNVPGYLDRPYRKTTEGGAERLEPEGPARWRLRVCPTAAGNYQIRVTFTDRSGSKTQNGEFRCVESAERGFVTVGEKHFAFANGTSYWPLGPNFAPQGDYEGWLAKLADHGANYVRVPLAPSDALLAQERPGLPEEGKGVGQIDLANAWRLDRLLALARQRGVYATLVLDDWSELRFGGGWERAAQNSDLGGPLRIWRDYWTNETMDRLYRNRLRYLVARYGADAHVFAWEFWNEVDRVSEFDAAAVRDWHQRMARALNGLDGYRHLRTTSVSPVVGLRTLDLIPELDFMQTHAVGVADPGVVVAAQQSRKSAWGKPHFAGRVAGDPGAEDVDGLQAHDALWASIATASSGGASVAATGAPNAEVYDAVSRFVGDVDWTAERFRQTDVALSPADPKLPIPPGDLVMEDGPLTGNPTMATVSKGVFQGAMPSTVLHGIVNHADLHNPFMLRVRVVQPTRFEIAVSTVSGEGGAKLNVNLDGKQVLNREFADPDWKEKTDDLRQYAGVFPINLSPGVHTLVVANKGVDWLRASYRLVGVVPRKKPPLYAWAAVGDTKVLGWVRQVDRNWRSAGEQKRNFPAVPPTVMRLRGLRSGTWRVEIWDTWAGKPVSTVHTKVGIDGAVRIVLPRIEKDAGVKLVREGS